MPHAYRLVREYEQRFRVGGRAALIDAEGGPDPQDTPTRREQQLRAEQRNCAPCFWTRPLVQARRGIDCRRAACPLFLSLFSAALNECAVLDPRHYAISRSLARFSERHVLLEHQHRMHPDIAVFPRDRVYGGKALATDDTMFRRRSWGFEADQPRARWLHVGAPCAGRKSTHEADLVISRVDRFVQWAKANPHHDEEGTPDGKPWEVAVLTFYRAQERLLRDRLRDESGQHYANHLFRVGPRERPVCTIRLCTVDRFQGQEADLVVISIANDHTTTFLESLNRLNVAITRARYLLLIVGNKQAMGRDRSHGTLIHELAHSKEIHFEGDLRERRRNGSH
ncbi:MAG: AAA domain-containing protein [Phycisphaerales bacterium]